jgi:hypothetical protein
MFAECNPSVKLVQSLLMSVQFETCLISCNNLAGLSHAEQAKASGAVKNVRATIQSLLHQLTIMYTPQPPTCLCQNLEEINEAGGEYTANRNRERELVSEHGLTDLDQQEQVRRCPELITVRRRIELALQFIQRHN